MSRPKHVPTPEQRRQVLTLAGFGITQDEIAGLLRLAPKTLRLHYRYELDHGATHANAAVAQSLFNMAVREKVPAAAIWWTKARMGWRGVGDPAGDMPLQVDFRWADAPLESSASKRDREAPTIDAAAENAVTEDAAAEDQGSDLVIWAGE